MAKSMDKRGEAGSSLRVSWKEFLRNRGAYYLLLMGLVVVGYALLVSGLSLIFSTASGTAQPLIIGLAVFILAVLVIPFQGRLQAAVNAVFLKGERVFQERAQDFADEMARLSDRAAIYGLLRSTIVELYHPQGLHIFTFDKVNDRYQAAADENGQPTSDLHFLASSAVVQSIGEQRRTMRMRAIEQLSGVAAAEKSRLALLGCELFAPIPGRKYGFGTFRQAQAIGEHTSDRAGVVSDRKCFIKTAFGRRSRPDVCLGRHAHTPLPHQQ